MSGFQHREMLYAPLFRSHHNAPLRPCGLAQATARLSNRLDLAFLALWSMIPDIVDKPLGLLVFGSPNMGRTFAHTILFRKTEMGHMPAKGSN